jgi:hypothetical protein
MIDSPLQCCIMERLDISGNGNPSAQRRIATNKTMPQTFPAGSPDMSALLLH